MNEEKWEGWEENEEKKSAKVNACGADEVHCMHAQNKDR